MTSGYVRPTSHNHVPESVVAGGRDLATEGQQQNVKSARVYVFGDARLGEDEFNDQNDVEMPELRARGSGKRQLPETTVEDEEDLPKYFEKTLSSDDTLLGVALKYGCKVSQLKRLNNLIQDQDFYGLRVIRIPLRRHGLLTELISEHVNGDARQELPQGGATGVNGHNGTADYDVMDDDDEEEEDIYDAERDTERRALLVRNVSIRDSFGTQSREAVNFLKKMDSDIKSIVTNTNSRKDTLEEVRDTLTCKSIHPLGGRRKIFDGVDCGMRWWSILIVMLVLLLGCPLLYFLYFEYYKPGS